MQRSDVSEHTEDARNKVMQSTPYRRLATKAGNGQTNLTLAESVLNA
ncbi:hypothetical protein N8198_09450 [Gammaproteobacteria bacterium]|nr:hypothetical protein [Gammaproteobacteria bacterium]